jgi:hypothetical protein
VWRVTRVHLHGQMGRQMISRKANVNDELDDELDENAFTVDIDDEIERQRWACSWWAFRDRFILDPFTRIYYAHSLNKWVCRYDIMTLHAMG